MSTKIRHQKTNLSNYQQSEATSFMIHCPVSGKPVILKNHRESIDIPHGQAIWWHCPSCYGWHILIENYKERRCADVL